MAKRSEEVLNKVNTLNSNLENANIAEVQKNISDRLFGVLDGANSISVDSELYASINSVANASDIGSFINREKGQLPQAPADRIPINYAGGGYHVNNTIINLAPGAPIDDTQNAINNMNNAINGLNALPGQINTLRNRLQENLGILDDAYDTQSDFEAAGYVRRRPNLIQNDINLCNNLQGYLRTIDDSERYLSTHPGNAYYEGRRDAAVIDFNNNRIAGIDEYNDYGADFGRISGQVRNALRGFTQERDLGAELVRNENRFNKTQCAVPGDLGLLFDANHTVINTPFVSAADMDTDRGNIRDWLAQLNVLEGQIGALRARYQDNLNRLNRILALQQLEQRMNAGEMRRRHNEFRTIRDISNHHLLLGEAAYEPYLPNQTINVGGNLGPVNLDFIDSYGDLAPAGRTANYSLCNEAGNPLRNNGGSLELQLEGGQTINIRGITFDDVAQTMMINNLTITPIEGLTFPLNLDLNVRVRIHDNDTGLDVDHHKPIHLEITAPTLPRASLNPLDPSREHAYDSLVPPMNDRITAEYTDRYREELENEAIWKILREGGNEAEVNEIYNNETRRELLINRIRGRLIGQFPLLSLADLQTRFRADMTRENRDVPVQYLLNQDAFQNYIRQSIPDNLRNYASGQINNNANAHRDDILQGLLDFQADVANNKVDNNDNLTVLGRVPDDAHGPQSHPDSRRQKFRGRRSRRNNYTKFFQGRSANLENQTLETEDGEIKYGVNVEVSGVNKIVATINIDGKEEPEIIEAASHDRLIRGILTRANTKDGEPLNRKLRCNIALSILKAMVMMSPQKLSREIPATLFYGVRGDFVNCDRIEAGIHGGNLRIRGGGVNSATHTRQNVVIFDENQFKNLHDVHALEDGIRTLSTQINSIMNATAQEYQEATNQIINNDGLRGLFTNNAENRGLLKYDTAQWLRGGPIKRLRGRIAYGKTNNNFDFDTSVNEAGKNVNIAFKGGKFTVSGEFDGQEYNFEAKDLGSILRKKINRKRVFDGIELAMVAAINEQYVERLRTNNLVQTENFAVADLNENKTGKVYIFDEAGNLSYLEIEDRGFNPLGTRNSGRINHDDLPTEGVRIRCNEQERREFMQNPLLAGRLMREMRRRLAF